jgi:hypothetical protein
VKIKLGAKARAFVRDIALTAAASVTTEVAPIIARYGLVHVTRAQWLGVADRAGSAVVLAACALAGTPLTRRYGVGSGMLERMASAASPAIARALPTAAHGSAGERAAATLGQPMAGVVQPMPAPGTPGTAPPG